MFTEVFKLREGTFVFPILFTYGYGLLSSDKQLGKVVFRMLSFSGRSINNEVS